MITAIKRLFAAILIVGYAHTANAQIFSGVINRFNLANIPSNDAAISAWGDSLTYGGQDYNGSNYAGDNYPGDIQVDTGRITYNWGWPAQNSTQILSRFQANPQTYNDFTSIWSGRNDDFSTPNVTLGNIASMVGALPSGRNRYVVMTILNAQYEPSGSSAYNNLAVINAGILSAYPNNYIDIRSILVAAYNPGNPADVANHAADLTPVTLRSVLNTAATTTAITTVSTCSFTVTIPGSVPHNGDIMLIGSEYITLDTVNSSGVVSACTRGYGGTTAATYTAGTTFTAYDYLHLNAAGYQIVATQVENFIAAHDPLANSKSPLFTTDAFWNTRLGNQALGAITTGSYNAAFGGQTLASDTTGYYNSAFGQWAMQLNTTGHDNVALGFNALSTNTTGNLNVAVGSDALQNQTTASDNTAVGTQAGQKMTTGHDNSMVGLFAGLNMTTGTFNDLTGVDAGFAITTSSFNNLHGYKAGFKITTGNSNTVLGDEVASTTLTTGGSNLLIGTSSGVDTPTSSTSNYLNIGNIIWGDKSKGILGVEGPTTVVSACGTSPSLLTGSNDIAGEVTAGATATTCTISFANTHTAKPVCTVTAQTALSNLAYSVSTTALTVTGTGLGGDIIDYHCVAVSNSANPTP